MFFEFSEEIKAAAKKAESRIGASFKRIDEITEYNQQKVLSAFIKNRISETHFAPSTGYGYGDRGRELLDRVFADIFGAEDALVRHSFMSGTHAISVALFGILRPGDVMLSITGRPYDTLIDVIGLNGKGNGSLIDFGIKYDEVPLNGEGRIDREKVLQKLTPEVRVVYMQRSRGYTLRPTLSVEDIEEITASVKAVRPDVVVMVDNCYGEFTEKREPCDVGADVIIGSLIKNAGGGIAETGGYIAGRKELIELCACRHTTPSTGREIGATLGHTKSMFMGIFFAPHVTGEALKTAVFSAALMEELGFEVTPRPDEERYDIIQAIKLETPEKLIAFCQGMQSGAPIDSFVVPEPWDMPGYNSQVIMAAGAFTLGSSIELSADAPLREPFAVWMQGGLNYHSAKAGVMLAADRLLTSMQEAER